MIMLFGSINPLLAENNPQKGRLYALLIGVSTNYYNEPWLTITYASKDAFRMDKILKRSWRGDEPQTFVMTDILANGTQRHETDALFPSKENIYLKIKEIKDKLKNEDTFILYFSGYGFSDFPQPMDLIIDDFQNYFYNHFDENRRINFLVTPASKGFDHANSLNLDKLILKVLKMGKTPNKLMILDASREVAYPRKYYRQSFNPITYISSLSHYGLSILYGTHDDAEIYHEPYHDNEGVKEDIKTGVFTHFLIKGLKGDADIWTGNKEKGKDRIVTLWELYTFLRNAVPKHVYDSFMARQIPDFTKVGFPHSISFYVDKSDYYLKKANELRDKSKYKEAILFYKKALIYDKNKDLIFLNLGHLYYRMQNYIKASQFYMKSIKIEKTKEAYLGYARSMHYIKQPELAIKYYNLIIGLDPSFIEAYRMVAFLYHSIGEHDKAIENYEKLFELSPIKAKSKAYYLKYGFSLYHTYNMDGALKVFEEVLEKPIGVDDVSEDDKTKAYYFWAKILMDKEKYTEAIDRFKAITAREAKLAAKTYTNKAFYLMAKAMLLTNRKYEAIDALKAIVSSKLKNDNDKTIYANAYWELAKIFLAENNYQKAINYAKKSEEYDKTGTKKFLIDVYIKWGKILYEQEKYEKAIEKFKETAFLSSPVIEQNAYLWWGKTLYQMARKTNNKKLYQEAIDKFKQVIVKEPEKEKNLDSADLYFVWGKTYYEIESYVNALEKFKIALALNPDNIEDINKWISETNSKIEEIKKDDEQETEDGEGSREVE